MSPKKEKSQGKESKEIPGIFSDIKIDVNALDGNYNKGNTISGDETSTYRPYTIFGNGEFVCWTPDQRKKGFVGELIQRREVRETLFPDGIVVNLLRILMGTEMIVNCR